MGACEFAEYGDLKERGKNLKLAQKFQRLESQCSGFEVSFLAHTVGEEVAFLIIQGANVGSHIGRIGDSNTEVLEPQEGIFYCFNV